MDGGQAHLRDRMLRDAIVEVLRGPFDPTGQGAEISLIETGLIGHVAVDEDRVRVELPLPGGWSPFAGCLVAEVQRRVEALPEVSVTEIIVTSTQPGMAPQNDHHVPPTRGEGKRPSSGWASLTPTELDVVKLVATGLTNPEIGKRLFIGRGTVNTHLAHVFTKLGVSTRSELAAEVTRRGL